MAATRRGKRRLRGRDRIGERVGKAIGKFRMAKHFEWDIDDNGAFAHRRNAASIAAEAALDGLCVIRTSLPETELDDQGAVERAFRSLKSFDLNARPVFHRTAERVRAHVLLRMLVHYVEWHMRRRLAPLLLDDEDPAGAKAPNPSTPSPDPPNCSAGPSGCSACVCNSVPSNEPPKIPPFPKNQCVRSDRLWKFRLENIHRVTSEQIGPDDMVVV